MRFLQRHAVRSSNPVAKVTLDNATTMLSLRRHKALLAFGVTHSLLLHSCVLLQWSSATSKRSVRPIPSSRNAELPGFTFRPVRNLFLQFNPLATVKRTGRENDLNSQQPGVGAEL